MSKKTVSSSPSSTCKEYLMPFGEADFLIKGRREIIEVTTVGPDKDTPLEIREALVGMRVEVFFTKEMIVEQCGRRHNRLPEGCRIAYAEEVIRLLKEKGEEGLARVLKRLAPGEFDFYVFEAGIYKIVG